MNSGIINNQNREISRAVTFKELRVTCPAFNDGDLIPGKYTCDGENINPPLTIDDIPEDTRSLAIIMTGTYDEKQEWAHWLAWNIPPVSHITEGRRMEQQGLNYFSMKNYEGPCPSGGRHKYTFKIYALDTLLHLSSCTLKTELEKAISDHILAFGFISCCYQRQIRRQSR